VLDFDVRRCTRRCHASERELQPGEEFYSVLVPQGSEVVRQDFAASAWEGPPEQNIGWWKSQMPEAGAVKVKMAPPDVLLDYFEQLEHVADKTDVRYVMALLLVRKRLAKWEVTETDDQGNRIMLLDCSRTQQQYRVIECDPTPEQIMQIRDELMQTLYAEAE
jgi:hypothetical protein